MSFLTRLAALLVVVAVWSMPAGAAPKAALWDVWAAHDPASAIAVDHAGWDRFLGQYVRPGSDGVNRVAYDEVTTADRKALDGYIDALAAVPVRSLSQAEQLPLWVNLYNALTVRVVLEHYPVASIRDIDISPGFFADGPWGKKLVTVEGEAVSLDDIEHRILRPIWSDPRIHYAVNCASLGCPNLHTRAMTAENAEAFLEEAAIAFINHPRGARIEDGKLYVSSIYDWFDVDFGGNDAGVIAHLKAYAQGELAGALTGVSRIADDSYDWRLNGTVSP
ncbi:DUF547 domain-containing protein [Nisaea nitritireducens]|uniref:DUF547 domain-containing protein n=1 Tax=Nisaea nitritireducens TaxID=568392 RepID=UPI001869381B|nr:DUF547 domain-containing protein [Nisaea nitritireducens]